MIRRALSVAFLVACLAGLALAETDIDRHGTYSDKDASGAIAQKCKSFVGTDDNRSACADWCTNYTSANAGATCACNDGACVEGVAPQAAAAPGASQ